MKSFLSKARIVALILVIAFLNGCASVIATFCTEDPDRMENKIYSGVRVDATIIEKGGGCGGGGLVLFALIDVPFSLVLDTIFLPYTTAYYFDQSNPSKYLKNHPGSFSSSNPSNQKPVSEEEKVGPVENDRMTGAKPDETDSVSKN